ncbi:hypothetical protein BG003_005078 [Podila horticola]|nr:hypothetical protein BG003_005078 [Podila horticola]
MSGLASKEAHANVYTADNAGDNGITNIEVGYIDFISARHRALQRLGASETRIIASQTILEALVPLDVNINCQMNV